MSEREANAVISNVFLIAALISPIIGFMVDKTGKNLYWMYSSILLTLLGHALIAFTFLSPWIAVSLIGVGYTGLASTLWPLISFIIPIHQLGTAYGLVQSLQNLGMALASMAAGAIVDYKGYITVENFYLSSLSSKLITIA
jgi:major facilitator superfamily domain-containing protein 1